MYFKSVYKIGYLPSCEKELIGICGGSLDHLVPQK